MMLGEGESQSYTCRSLGLQIQLKRKQELGHKVSAISSTLHNAPAQRRIKTGKETRLQSIGEQEARTPIKQKVS